MQNESSRLMQEIIGGNYQEHPPATPSMKPGQLPISEIFNRVVKKDPFMNQKKFMTAHEKNLYESIDS